jgi:hypothetical protein
MSDTDTGAALAAPDAGTVDTATPSNEVVKDNSWDSIESTMDAAWDKLNPAREDDGKFKGEAKAAPAEGETPEADKPLEASPVAASPEPATPAIGAPQSLPADLKAEWAKVPPSLQSWTAQREAEAHKRISELGQTVKATEPIRQVIDHYRGDFQARQMEPARGIAALMEVQRMLDKDFVSGINAVAEAYGKPSPFASSQSPEGGQESGLVRSLQAEIQSLKRDVGQTREHVMAEQRSKQEREAANLATLVDDFSKDKTDFSEIESDVVAHIHAIRAAEPGLDNKALLAKAYDAARWANPTTRSKLLETQRKDEETKRTEESKRKAADAQKAAKLNVKSSSGASPSRKGSWEDTLAAAADAAFSR